jgi:hypothetical protein
MRPWPRRQDPPRRRLRDRRWAQVTAGVLIVLVGFVGWSLGNALIQPGGGTTAQRVAEWARGHYLGPLVTLAEQLTYQPPRVGGRPSFSLAGPRPPASAAPTAGRTAPARVRPGFEVPRRLASPAGKPLPGEGQWRVLSSVHGTPAVYATYLRPDRVHTSYVSAIVSMNPHLLRFQLRPGVEDPGPGSYGGVPPVIAPGHRRGLVATFNGGFKIASAEGGFWLNGTERGPLLKGSATMVYYRDGDLRMGVWGPHLHLTPQVEGVRQNLKPIIEDGRIPASIDQNIESNWGATIGGAYYVWRSGVGVTRDGRIIFAYGPALDARTLAGLLQRAGCQFAMELDINPDWTDFMYYKPAGHPADPTPVALLPGQVQPADRYYALTNRDFTAVFSR